MTTDGSLWESPEPLTVNICITQSRALPAYWAVTEPSVATPVMGLMPVPHETMSFDPAPAHQVKRRGYSSYEWAMIFPVLSRLYVDLDMTLPEVMQKLSAEQNFHATYVDLLTGWNPC